MDIPQGKTIGIVGESGSGKSTLGKAIINVLKLTAPDVWVAGNIFFNNSNKKDIDILSLDRNEILKYRSKNTNDFPRPFFIPKPKNDY